MIRSIHFHAFRILQEATLDLGAFNLLLGPNGSGKTTVVRALSAVGRVARSVLAQADPDPQPDFAGSTVRLELGDRFAGAHAILAHDSEGRPDLQVAGDLPAAAILEWLAGVRSLAIDPASLARPVPRHDPVLDSDGTGFPALLAALKERDPERWLVYLAEVNRLLPEVVGVEIIITKDGRTGFRVSNTSGLSLRPENLSQGTLVIMALVALSMDGARPSLVCFEEIERGIHPRLLRDVRDTLYRLSFPGDANEVLPSVQVVVTTHSPYLLDLFGDNPEDVILTEKAGEAAGFRRLSDVPELAQMLATGRLGDLWYSGILGGVP